MMVMPPNHYQTETLGHAVGPKTLDASRQECDVRGGLMPQ